jgi:hypothetical protein
MKFFIINSFRFLVYNAYFGIIALYTFGAFLERAQIQAVISQFTTSGKVLVERGMVDPQTGLVALEQKLAPGMLLSQPALSALSIVIGLIVGWVAATLICGVLVTLLDIRDDINDRLPRAK